VWSGSLVASPSGRSRPHVGGHAFLHDGGGSLGRPDSKRLAGFRIARNAGVSASVPRAIAADETGHPVHLRAESPFPMKATLTTRVSRTPWRNWSMTLATSAAGTGPTRSSQPRPSTCWVSRARMPASSSRRRTIVARRLPCPPDQRTSMPKPRLSRGQIVSRSGRVGARSAATLQPSALARRH
jgi:hypothetical protein